MSGDKELLIVNWFRFFRRSSLESLVIDQNVPLQKRPTPPQAPTIIVDTEGSNYILVELNGDALGFSANPHCPLGPLAET
jgi:hypothetical protein